MFPERWSTELTATHRSAVCPCGCCGCARRWAWRHLMQECCHVVEFEGGAVALMSAVRSGSVGGGKVIARMPSAGSLRTSSATTALPVHDFLLLGRWRVRLPLRSITPRHLNDVSQLQRIGAFESSATLSSLLIFFTRWFHSFMKNGARVSALGLGKI